MSSDKQFNSHVFLDGAVANGVGTGVDVRAYRHITIALGTSGTTTATIKIQGTADSTIPTWSSAASRTNHWDYIAHYDANDPSAVVTGDIGVVLAGADTVQNLIVNTDMINYLVLLHGMVDETEELDDDVVR